MKRYWKLAVLVPLIVVCIGFYYTNVAGSNYIQYVLKMQEGNEKEASPVILHAGYNNGHDPINITSEGTEYLHDRPFWASWNGNNPKLEKLMKEHRYFMRGKNNPQAFYEDGQVLAYGGIKADYSQQRRDFRFTVSVYDKKRKETSSFEAVAPKEDLYRNIYLYDVRVDGRTMKLFTFNMEKSENKPEDKAKQEAHLYTLDLEKKNVAEDQVIVSAVPPDENTRVRLGGAFSRDSTKQSGYLVYQITHNKKEPGAKPKGTNVSEAYTLEKRELFVYDIKSGKLEPIQSEEMNELLQDIVGFDISQSGDDLFLTSSRRKIEKAPRIIKYSLTEKKVKSNLEIALNDSTLDTVPLNFSAAANNRLYMLYNTGNGIPTNSTVVIAELDKGEIVYKGTVSRKDGQDLLGNLRVDYIEIR